MGTRQVQFTGERTGMTTLVVPIYGLLSVGDVIELPEDVAERWTTSLPSAGGALLADFAYVAAVPLPEDPIEEPAEATTEIQPETAPPTRKAARTKNPTPKE